MDKIFWVSDHAGRVPVNAYTGELIFDPNNNHLFLHPEFGIPKVDIREYCERHQIQRSALVGKTIELIEFGHWNTTGKYEPFHVGFRDLIVQNKTEQSQH